MQSLRHIVRLFLIACCSPLFAFPPTETSFPHLLNERGEIVSNILQPAYAQYGKIVFSGQITLTGVLERSDNDEEGVYNDELRFYPDSNLSLPFMYDSFPPFGDDENKTLWKQSTKGNQHNTFETKIIITNPKLFSTLFERLRFGVLLTNRDALLPKLPQALQERIYGASGVRVRITLTDYRFYGEGDAGHEAWAKAIEILPLGDSKREYARFSTHHEGKQGRASFNLSTKDSYVNLRKSPNGEIITPITKEAMAQGAMIVSANYEQGSCEDISQCLAQKGKWVEVYYLPPNAKSGKDVFFGLIHSSQIAPNNLLQDTCALVSRAQILSFF